MKHIIRKMASFVRWKDWGAGKIPLLFTLLAYIIIANREFSNIQVIYFPAFILFAMLQSAVGYVINNWGDREIDKLHGKQNAFLEMGKSSGVVSITVLLLFALISGIPFFNRPYFLLLWAIWIFFTFSYSLKPLRLKERGIWGLPVVSIAQWTMPILITFSAMKRFGSIDMIAFALINTVCGATIELAHQRWDRNNDISTETNTFASKTSAAKLDKYYSFALMLDKTAIMFLTLIISNLTYGLFQQGIWSVLALLLPIFYILILCLSIYEIKKSSSRGILLDPYYSQQHSANKVLHETLSNIVIPVYLLLILSFNQPLYWILLGAFLYLRIILGKADWLWPIRFVFDGIKKIF